MGNRLSKIYTRTGDKGTTGMATGERLPKHHDRMETIGDVDELNSAIGVLFESLPNDHSRRDFLTHIQHDCFDLGGELAMPGHQLLPLTAVTDIEGFIDTINAQLPPLKDFILPAGSIAAAQCHVARAVCRRAERHMWRLITADANNVNPLAAAYLNRLSDFLFVLARELARENDGSEVLWRSRLAAPNKKN